MSEETKVHCTRLKPGLFQITVEFPRRRGEKRERKRINFRGTEKQAHDKCKELERQHNGTVTGFAPSTQTLIQAINSTLLTRHQDGFMSELTYKGKLAQARVHIQPHPIANIPLVRLLPSHLEDFKGSLAQPGAAKGRGKAGPLKAGSRTNIMSLITLAIGFAYRQRTVEHDVSGMVTSIKQDKTRGQAVEPESLTRFFSVIKSRDLRELFELLLRTGLRRGEVCGLCFDDLDLDPTDGGLPMLHVRRSIQRQAQHTFVTPPKTEAGARSMPLSEELTAMLRRRLHVARQTALARGVKPGSLPVFPGKDGSFMPPNSLTGQFAYLREKAGLEGFRLHDFRHTFVTMSLRGTRNVTLVSARAGHRDSRVTLGIYGHVMKEDAARIVDPFAGVDLQASPAPVAPLPKRSAS